MLTDRELRREAIDARRSLAARALHGPFGRMFAKADLAGMRLIRSTARSPRATDAIVRFSRTGEHGALWLAIGGAGVAIDGRRRERWAIGVAAVAAAYVANTTVKQVARRPRPQLRDLPPLVPTPTQLSFPSSHAASSFAAATAYSGLLPRGPLFATAGAMALSRVHLGVHYPTDILVGATLGAVTGRLVRGLGSLIVAPGHEPGARGGPIPPPAAAGPAPGAGASAMGAQDSTTTEGPTR